MTQPNQPPQPSTDEKRIREEEEAADRARGRTPGAGESPKTDEVPVPPADQAPSAPSNEG